jgi:hypothetical protein
MPLAPPPLAPAGLLHCHVCNRPGGKALLGPGSVVEVRCHDGCKQTTMTVGPFPRPLGAHLAPTPLVRLVDACIVACQSCDRRLARALLAPGSSYEGRCRSCKLLTTRTGPWPWPPHHVAG